MSPRGKGPRRKGPRVPIELLAHPRLRHRIPIELLNHPRLARRVLDAVANPDAAIIPIELLAHPELARQVLDALAESTVCTRCSTVTLYVDDIVDTPAGVLCPTCAAKKTPKP